MSKKCSTDQRCIRKRNTTYKLGTLRAYCPNIYYIYILCFTCRNLWDFFSELNRSRRGNSSRPQPTKVRFDKILAYDNLLTVQAVPFLDAYPRVKCWHFSEVFNKRNYLNKKMVDRPAKISTAKWHWLFTTSK